MSVDLVVEVAPGVYGPGDRVPGAVVVLRGGKARKLVVSLVYRERSPDYTYAAIEASACTLHSGHLETGARFDFAVDMPADALPGQQLAHGETYWEVAARCDRRGWDVHASARLDDAAAAVQAPDQAASDVSGLPLLDPRWLERQRRHKAR